MHRSLHKLGYVLEKDQITKQEIALIKHELTVSPFVIPAFKEFNKNDSSYPIYLESPKRLFVPRFYGIEKWGQPTKNLLGQGVPISVNDKINLFPHQLIAFDKTIQHLKKKWGWGIISTMWLW